MKDIAEKIGGKIHKSQMDRAYDLVKLILFQNRTKSSIVKYKVGELLINAEDISDRWKQYMEELYNGECFTEEGKYIEQEDEVGIDFKGSSIIRSSKQFKNNRAAGPDLMKS